MTSWHAQPVPADPARSLVLIEWDNVNHEIEFEMLQGVLWLGHAWEQPPVEALPLLASFGGPSALATTTSASTPATDSPPPTSVANALRNTGWPAARLVR